MQAMVITRSIPGQERGMGRRTVELLKAVAAAGFDIHLVSLVPPGQSPQRAQELRGICRWAHLFEHRVRHRVSAILSYARHGSYLQARDRHAGLDRQIAELLPQVQLAVCVDALFFDALARHPLGPGKAPLGDRPAVLLDLAEPLSQRLTLRARQVGLPASWIMHNEILALRRMEVIATQMADVTLVSNDVDLQMLGQRVSGGRLRMVANGADVNDSPTPAQLARLPDAVAFCGELAIPHHQRAAAWMANVVMPLVRRERPEAVLRLIGQDFPKPIRALAGRRGVELVDLSARAMTLRLALLQCPVAVAPQRQPRGATEATLLALACGRPVVCTLAVAANLPGEAAVAPHRADKAEPIAQAISRFLGDRAQAFRAGLHAYELVEANASWAAQFRRLGALLGELVPAPVAGGHASPDEAATQVGQGASADGAACETAAQDPAAHLAAHDAAHAPR